MSPKSAGSKSRGQKLLKVQEVFKVRGTGPTWKILSPFPFIISFFITLYTIFILIFLLEGDKAAGVN